MHFYHLAQMNIARALAPPTSPLLADFMAQIVDVNQLAESSPGFVWRLKDEASGNATSIQAFENDPFLLTNMSVWEGVEELRDFVYRSAHGGVYRDRSRWFEPPVRGVPQQVLWWIPAGHTPSPAEGQARLEHLRSTGAPSPFAFTFAHPSPRPDSPPAPEEDAGPGPMDLDGRRFTVVSNSAAGDLAPGVEFHYRQSGRRVWCVYESLPRVRFGTLVALMDSQGALDMRYQHLDGAGVYRTGQCRSTPERDGAGGRLHLNEAWQWTNGDESSGASVLAEVLP